MPFTDEQIDEAFKKFDKDGNQTIECSELKGILKKHCDGLSDKKLDKLVKVRLDIFVV